MDPQIKQEALARLHDIIQPVAALIPSLTPRTLATGFAPLDARLGGGLPVGQLSVLIGQPTSGISTLAYRLMAHSGQPTLYLDLSRRFDTTYAERCGVALDRLVLVRPSDAAQALDIARDALAYLREGLIILDCDGQPPGESLLRRIANPLAKSGAAFVLLCSGCPARSASAAAIRLHFERLAWLTRDDDVIGCRTAVTVAKQRGGASGDAVALDLYFAGEGA